MKLSILEWFVIIFAHCMFRDSKMCVCVSVCVCVCGIYKQLIPEPLMSLQVNMLPSLNIVSDFAKKEHELIKLLFYKS